MADEQLNGEPQRCALPGCHEIIVQPAEGGAPRKYCSAAHRVSGRKLRQAERLATASVAATEAAASTQDVVRPSEPAPVVYRPAVRTARLAAQRVGGTTRIVAQRTSRKARGIARRARSGSGSGRAAGQASRATTLGRRAVAVLGAASILGGTVQVVQSLQQAPTPDGASGSQPSTDPAIARVSLERALTQVTGELDKVTKALAWWNQQNWSGSKPFQVTALEQRFDVLSTQLNTLLAMQTAQNQLGPITSELAAADSQLADVSRSLQAPPTTGSATAQAAYEGLAAQQQMLSERRNALAMQLDTTRRAATAPLPAVPTDTDQVVGNVMAMPLQAPPQEPATQRREPVAGVINRTGGSEDRDVATIGAPPRSNPPTLLPLTDGTSGSGGSGDDGDLGQGGAVTRQVGNVAQVDELPAAGLGGSETPDPQTPAPGSPDPAEVAAAQQAAMQAWRDWTQSQPGQPADAARPGQTPPQQGSTPPPQGQTPPPKGQTAPPKGQTAPPKGEAAPPKGEAAPPKGEAAPPKGEAAPPKGETPPKGEAAPPKGEAAPPKGEAAPPADDHPVDTPAETRPQQVQQDDNHPTRESERPSAGHSAAASEDDGPPAVARFKAKHDEAKRERSEGSDDESPSEESGSRPRWTMSGGDSDDDSRSEGSGSGSRWTMSGSDSDGESGSDSDESDGESSSGGSDSDWSSVFSEAS